MNGLKRILGVIWILAGLGLAAYMPYRAISKLTTPAASTEDFVFWIVVVTIFIPIIIGFILFGYYAVKGEYADA
ncbi:MAG TPA: hypothetical protein VFE57_10995 [Cyclobacteriaceae bacterium]|jgi:hypothetical protein|nr:hypothetical protein [Cyclobacteriaceae bacterium]